MDPAESNLLFERFLSPERREPPDIDVDFEHERREEVIQYIYQRYGRHRAGIAATVIHYRPKLAIARSGQGDGNDRGRHRRLVHPVLATARALWDDTRLARNRALIRTATLVRRTIDLARELVGLPRHLSQHVGGFVLTRDPLDETVPIGNAGDGATASFIEWDKDDIDILGIMKVDVLALGMLTCVRKAFDLAERSPRVRRRCANLADIPREDPETVCDMLCNGARASACSRSRAGRR